VGLTIFQVDAFTDRKFAGNPAAVCLLVEPRDEKWMQDMAREINLPATAYLHRHQDGFNLRWFTTNAELTLCGHATLASAHVLWETGQLKETDEARFSTQGGLLTARRLGDWIELDFPAKREERTKAPAGLERALGASAKYVGRNALDYLVEVESAAVLRGLRPDLSSLKSLDVRGVIVTSPSDAPEYDFLSRFFAPGAGIDEDQVTGSAHCCLGPYWANRLQKNELKAYQASQRGGVVRVRVKGDRVYLGGQAVTVMRGELLSEEKD
jgi:PhzF family phenazine biosynthesis protein